MGSADYAPRPYAPDRIDRKPVLGSVDEWKLQSLFVSHPFHIHVNPFQVVAIYDPAGKDVSAPGAVDDYALDANGKPIKGTPDPQYPGLKGVWKDTLWVKNVNDPNGPTPGASIGMYMIVIRTRYERYIGEFVLHCHILDHEDQGMMQNVEIVPPTYSPPPATAMPA
ncbi:MAG: multicopper oxidase domain-containing protein [Rhizomicrobium sp.]